MPAVVVHHGIVRICGLNACGELSRSRAAKVLVERLGVPGLESRLTRLLTCLKPYYRDLSRPSRGVGKGTRETVAAVRVLDRERDQE